MCLSSRSTLERPELISLLTLRANVVCGISASSCNLISLAPSVVLVSHRHTMVWTGAGDEVDEKGNLTACHVSRILCQSKIQSLDEGEDFAHIAQVILQGRRAHATPRHPWTAQVCMMSSDSRCEATRMHARGFGFCALRVPVECTAATARRVGGREAGRSVVRGRC